MIESCFYSVYQFFKPFTYLLLFGFYLIGRHVPQANSNADSASITSLLAAMFPELPLNGHFPGYRPASATGEHISSRSLYRTIPARSCAGSLDLVQLSDRLASESLSKSSTRAFRDKDVKSRSPENRKGRGGRGAESRSIYGSTYQTTLQTSKTAAGFPGNRSETKETDDKVRSRLSYSETLDRTPSERKNTQDIGKYHTNSLQFWRTQPNGRTNPSPVKNDGPAVKSFSHTIQPEFPLDETRRRQQSINGRSTDDFDFPFPGSLGRPARVRETAQQLQNNKTASASTADKFSDVTSMISRHAVADYELYSRGAPHPERVAKDSKLARTGARKPRYEILSAATEPPPVKLYEKAARRPHSAPAVEAESVENSRCGHRARKPCTVPPHGYKQRQQLQTTNGSSNVCEVENNNTIILKVDKKKSTTETVGRLSNDESSNNKENNPSNKVSASAGTATATRLRCASVPVDQNRVVVPRSAISLPCMPMGDGKDVFAASFPVVQSLLGSPPSTRPSSLTTSSSSSNLTSECSGWVSSGDTSSSDNQATLKISGQMLRQKLSKIAAESKADTESLEARESVEHSYEEVRLPPPKMFQDEPPPPEEFQDPPAPIDNPIYHVYETVKSVTNNQKQCKTAPCSPQRNRIRDSSYAAQDVCFDCYQEGKELLQSTQDHIVNFNKCKEEFKQQMGFSGKIYR